VRTLYFGLAGSDVLAWKLFLRGHDPYSELIVDDDKFDVDTVNETKEFQRSAGFRGDDVDGVVGPLTLAVALQRGFCVISDDRDDVNGPNWPKKPADSGPASYDWRLKTFGSFSFVPANVPGNPEAIRITDGWHKKNITNVTFPAPVGQVRSSQFHVLIAQQVVSLLQEWYALGMWDRIVTWGGSWVPRFVRGSRSVLSNHAWGTAFDINVQWNQLGRVPALRGERGSVRELVDTAAAHGFFWGGGFANGRVDGMHFEAAKLIK
jgi:hypothetical protein